MNIFKDFTKSLFLLFISFFFSVSIFAQVSSLPNGFPSNNASEGKIIAASQGLASLGAPPPSGELFNVHIRVPLTETEVNIELFDPELHADVTTPGYWDFPSLNAEVSAYEELVRFELYPDVDIAGNTASGELIASYLADSSSDNQWVDFFQGSPIAVNPSDALACEQGVGAQFCFYHLVARWVEFDPPHDPKLNATTLFGNVLNGFIVSSNGLPFLAAGSSIGIIGMTQANPSFPVPATSYDGTLSLRALVTDTQVCALDIYDGDSDRAGTVGAADYPDESDDPNTPNDGVATGFFPFVLSGDTAEEGVNPGNPADNSPNAVVSIGVPISVTVSPEPPTASYGVSCCVNDNPSGNQEWELYRIAASMTTGCPAVTDPNYDPDDKSGSGGVNGPAPIAVPDEVVDVLGAGFHNITLNGMDANNLNFLNVTADIFAGEAFDFGDAPDSYGTTLGSNGAQHDIDAQLTLGVEVDLEFDGVPSVGADSDDNAVLDDEDSVASFAVLDADMAGVNYSVDVAVRNELGVGNVATAYGWIDFDGDGAFEAGESASAPVNPGDTSVTLMFVIPANVSAGDTYARFRLTTDVSINTTTPGGLASDGEVEDYPLTIDSTNLPCSECDGKVTDLTLQYNGTIADAQITVEQKNGGIVFDDVVQPGESFSFSGTDNGTLGTEIEIFVNGVSNTKLHTSCSRPIGPGTVGEDFEVLSASSLNGGLICELGPCTATGENKLKLDKKKLEWKVKSTGESDIFIENLAIEWPAENGVLKKIKIGKKTLFEGALAPTSATISGSDWTAPVDDRKVKKGQGSTIKFEFEKNVSKDESDYKITINFIEGCSVEFTPGQSGGFSCAKPLDALTMIWDGIITEIGIKAWKDNPGEILLRDQSNIMLGDEVTVTGYAPKDGNDVIWEIFEQTTSGAKLGESVFHMSCSDDDMDGAEDCGKRNGDAKNQAGFINDWLLEGMVDANGELNCTP